MKISARNTFAGTVKKITKGAVNAEVDLTLKGGAEVVAIITNTSVETLGLKVGSPAYAIIKASSVMISTGSLKLSARNSLAGKVSVINDGAVNSEVHVKLNTGEEVVSIITKESVKSLGLTVGGDATAVIKASNVLIGVE